MVDELFRRLIHPGVLFDGEVLRLEELGDLFIRPIVDQKGAEKRLFRIQVVRHGTEPRHRAMVMTTARIAMVGGAVVVRVFGMRQGVFGGIGEGRVHGSVVIQSPRDGERNKESQGG